MQRASASSGERPGVGEPARGADRSLRDIDGDDDAIAECRDEVSERDRPEGGAADEHARHARVGERDRVGDAAHSTAELHRDGRGSGDDLTGELERRSSVPRRVERDHVDERRLAPRRRSDELEWVASLEVHAVVVALLEADGSSIENVHCRDH